MRQAGRWKAIGGVEVCSPAAESRICAQEKHVHTVLFTRVLCVQFKAFRAGQSSYLHLVYKEQEYIGLGEHP